MRSVWKTRWSGSVSLNQLPATFIRIVGRNVGIKSTAVNSRRPLSSFDLRI